MKQVIVFAGTTEGRLVSEWLARQGVETLCSVATEYGRQLVEEIPHLSVCRGRMTPERMCEVFEEEGRPLVVDLTHPYASVVSENIRGACHAAGAEYLRLIRPSELKEDRGEEKGDLICVGSVEEAAAYLAGTKGSVLVTTGSKELHKYTVIPDFQERVYARVLASPEVVKQCTELGFTGSHLICMQGPFSKELNTAMLRQTGARYLVTKESGRAGGFIEKLEAAREAGAAVVLIGRPPEQEGISVEEGVLLLKERFGISGDLSFSGKRKAWLVGIGMGTEDTLTQEALRRFEEADCILGSGRMLDMFRGFGKPLFDAYDPVKMTAYVKEHPEYGKIAVALSGDPGFYSGAKRLIASFEAEGIETELIAGISSVSYFCSRLKLPWEDVKLMSVHGRKENLIAAVRSHFRTFTLLGGRDTVQSLCARLMEHGLGGVKIYVGERLHYSDERITEGSPEKLMEGTYDGLCVALIENSGCFKGVRLAIPDEEFIRGGAPMTKCEVRGLSAAKLGLQRDSVVWDVGAGTGSVTVEMALQASEGCVYAIEKKPEAAALIGENCRKFGTPNVEVIEGSAPEALADLPAPTHVFIGGSSGNLKEILRVIFEKNPEARIVINAVTLETAGEANACLKELPVEDTEIIQIQASRARRAGSYHLMTGQNPVYIFSCKGKGATE